MIILTYDSVKSTNLLARQWLDNPQPKMNEDYVLVARKQTQGKTRKGDTWWSPEDRGIYMSVIRQYYAPGGALMEQFTSIVGKFLVLTLSKYFQLILEKRGINDLYLANRKLAGILCEYHAASGKLIVGVGLNTFRPLKVRKDLQSTAVWLNEYAAEHLIIHDKLVNMIAEEIIKT